MSNNGNRNSEESDNSNPDAKAIQIGEFVLIRRRGKKRTWVAEFRFGGEHRRVSLKTSRRAAAERKARELEVSLANQIFRPEPKAADIDAAVKQFIEAKKVDQRSAKTLAKYQAELNAFAAFAKARDVRAIQQITPGLHDGYRAERLKTLDPYTVYNHAVLLKGFTKWCESRDLTAVDPLRKVRLSEPVRANKWSPPLEVVNKLLVAASAADIKLEQMMAVLSFTGMRSGELVALRPRDVDLEGNWIHVTTRKDWRTKTGASRKIPISRRLRPYLIAALKASFNKPHLFCAEASAKYPKGDHAYSKDKLLQRLQKLAEKLGIPTGHADGGFVVHSLRHFFESFCINAGHIPQRAVDLWMGHIGDRSTGRVYYGLSDQESQSFMKQVPFDRAAATDQKGESNVA